MQVSDKVASQSPKTATEWEQQHKDAYASRVTKEDVVKTQTDPKCLSDELQELMSYCVPKDPANAATVRRT